MKRKDKDEDQKAEGASSSAKKLDPIDEGETPLLAFVQEVRGADGIVFTKTIDILGRFAKLITADLEELNSVIDSPLIPKELREDITQYIGEVQVVRLKCVEFCCQITPLLETLKLALGLYQYEKYKAIFANAMLELSRLKVEDKIASLFVEIGVPLQRSAPIRNRLAEIRATLHPKLKERLAGILDKITAQTLETVLVLAVTVGTAVPAGMLRAVVLTGTFGLVGVAYLNKRRKDQLLDTEDRHVGAVVSVVAAAEATLVDIMKHTKSIRIDAGVLLRICLDKVEEELMEEVRTRLNNLHLNVQALLEASMTGVNTRPAGVV